MKNQDLTLWIPYQTLLIISNKIISNVHKVKFVSVAFVYMQEHQMV